jgi:cysteine desulfurase/selenocysteine lyase
LKRDWVEIRKDFPITKKYSYLNNAAISPIPIPVYREACRFYKNMLDHGGKIWENYIKVREETRKRYAEFIGSNDSEIAFTHSTSEGMNIVSHMLSNRGLVILNDLEFPASNLPWINNNPKNIRFVKSRDNNRIELDDIVNLIGDLESKADNKIVKTVVTSHVQFSTGYRIDLNKLSKFTKQKKILLVVNSTQSLGSLYFNVEEQGVDFAVTNGHKWMLSSFGIGAIYINKKYLDKNHFKPPFFSHSGQKQIDNYENNKKIEMSENATRFEIGTPHLQNIALFNAAIKYISNIGIKNIERKILQLTGYIIKKLESLNFEIISPIKNENERSGIIVFKSQKLPPLSIVKRLEKENIIVSQRGRGIRISPHFYNNEGDIDKLILILEKL